MENNKIKAYFSYITFLFIILALCFSSAYVKNIISCDLNNYFENSIFFKHFILIIAIFAYIMNYGGMSFFDDKEYEDTNYWGSGNTISTLFISILIYLVILKCFNMTIRNSKIFFSLLFVLYFFDTQRSYWNVRSMISNEINNFIVYIEIILILCLILILIYDFILTIFSKKKYSDLIFKINKCK